MACNRYGIIDRPFTTPLSRERENLMRIRMSIAYVSVIVIVAAMSVAATMPQSPPASPFSVEPPDVAQERGVVPTPLPERWIAAADAGTTREYFEDILEYGKDDTAVRGHLVLTGNAAGTPQRFELTEFHLGVPSGQPTTLSRTLRSSGRVWVEQGHDADGPVTVYRLVTDPPASRTLTFIKAGTRLALATGTGGRLARVGQFGQALVASAAAQSVSLTHDADAAMKWKVRLHIGQTLDVKLAPLSAGRQWEYRGGATGPLMVRAGRPAPVADPTQPDGRVQVFRFAAVTAGWNDLRFEHGILKMTVRVKVEPGQGPAVPGPEVAAAGPPPDWEQTKDHLRELTFAGDNGKAIAIAEKLVADFPLFAEGHARLGGAHESTARELAGSNPDLALKHFDLAESHLRDAFEMGGGEYPEATIRGLIDLYDYVFLSQPKWKAAIVAALARYPGEPAAQWYGVQLVIREDRIADLDAALSKARAALTAVEARLDYASLLLGIAEDAQPTVKTTLIREARALADEASKKNPTNRIVRSKADSVIKDAARLLPK